MIIVGKRHHARFYPTEVSGADSKSGNPIPGTVVDRGVTSVYDFDFYLQAHAGLKGTARPAHYYVIHDEHSFGADELQEFTHQLCYLFGRATKGVSICPPAYYADLACERGRCYVHRLSLQDDTASVKSGSSDEDEENVKKFVRKEWVNGINPQLRDSMIYL